MITTDLRTDHAMLIERIAGERPNIIGRFTANGSDVRERRQHLDTIRTAFAAYVAAVLSDTDTAVSVREIDVTEFISQLADIFADTVLGPLDRAAERTDENEHEAAMAAGSRRMRA